MQKPAPRPQPQCAEPVTEPLGQRIAEKLRHTFNLASAPHRHYEKPVSWLLGRQMMGSIKGTLLYTAFGSKLDPRDWMQAEAFPACARSEAEQSWRELATRRAAHKGAGSAKPFWEPGGAFWFDYLSDTGDGMTATYSIAYLCMSELHVRGAEVRGPSLNVEPWREGDYETLPRGEFLFVGGDTAYHLSDYMTLTRRIQDTFEWAFDDLERKGLVSDDTDARRPLIGIPGNHDYYDQLDGFRRQFREPSERRTEDKTYPRGSLDAPQLRLPGFRRRQESSYVALRLPFDWWLWGFDTEVGRLDERQKDFFLSLCKNGGEPQKGVVPDKLIVATSAPTTVFGKLAISDDEKSTDAFKQLGISRPFFPDDERERLLGEHDKDHVAGLPIQELSGDATLRAGQCRLDLSGDVHHYARYWGPPNPDAPEPRPEDTQVEAPSADSYASVVSGIGGAFHHPSETFAGEIREQVLYPPEKCSREEVARGIFNFWTVLTGGSVYIAGFLIAFVLFFAAAVPQSSRQVFNNFCVYGFCPLRTLGLETWREPINPTVSPLQTSFDEKNAADNQRLNSPLGAALNESASRPVTPFARRAAASLFGVSPEWKPNPPCASDQPSYFFGPCRTRMPWDAFIGILMLLGSLVAVGATFYNSEKLFGKHEPGRAASEIEFKHSTVRWLWVIVAAISLLAFGGLILVAPYQAHITPFGNSLLVLFSIIWAVAATALSLRYGEWLYVKSQKEDVHKSDWWLSGLLSVLSVLSVGFGLWSFGRHNLPALLVSDILFLLVLFGSAIVLMYLAIKVGGDKKGPGGKYRGYFVLIGIWHAILQIAVPFLLIRKGSWLTLLLAALLVLVPIKLNFGERLMNSRTRRARRAGLLAAWVIYGALFLLLPLITWWILNPGGSFDGFRAYQGFWMPGGELAGAWSAYRGWWASLGGWVGLVPSVAAGLVGAVMCCLFFGWYLAVSLTFHGHNNEVGGAARIERFKEFVRFRVTEKDITGYVIAVDDPRKEGEKLRPKVIDVFRLKVK